MGDSWFLVIQSEAFHILCSIEGAVGTTEGDTLVIQSEAFHILCSIEGAVGTTEGDTLVIQRRSRRIQKTSEKLNHLQIKSHQPHKKWLSHVLPKISNDKNRPNSPLFKEGCRLADGVFLRTFPSIFKIFLKINKNKKLDKSPNPS
jgi:hypothetical protein